MFALLRLNLWLLIVYAAPLLAEENLGRLIAEKAWQSDRGFGDFSAHIVLTTLKKNGKKVVRKLRTRTIETPTGDKSISVFDYPADVKGYARLTYAHEDGNDDQWLYVPDLKRVKRISPANAGTPFMGTEYAFEDLGSQRPEEVGSFSYRFLNESNCGQNLNLMCYQIERKPKNPYSAYSKQIVWIDHRYRTRRIDYFDKKGRLIKTQNLMHYRLFKNRHWRPTEMQMINHQNGNQTLVKWDHYRFKNGFNVQDFTPGRLKNAR